MTMELSKNYIPAATEDKWNEHWTRQRYFNSRPDERPAFTVVIPPPNVTGVLHMGHTLNETVQDILVRNARMRGFNACWVPGSDHASIATEARVVAMLKERGIDKNQLRTEIPQSDKSPISKRELTHTNSPAIQAWPSQSSQQAGTMMFKSAICV